VGKRHPEHGSCLDIIIFNFNFRNEQFVKTDIIMKTRNSSNPSSRRKFLKHTLAGASSIALSPIVMSQTSAWTENGFPTRPLGKTGENVSIIGLGGWHIRSVQDDRDAFKMIDMAIGEGLTFFDNSWDYHKGAAEVLVGDALQKNGLRKKTFLMTKVCDRDYEGAKKQLEDSLKRFKTDYIDLWQFHEFIYDNDPDWVFDKGGIKAAIEAKKAGKVRYIGFTGHKDPRIHLKTIQKPFDWDTVQLPVNILDASYRSFQKEVIPVCKEKQIGVIGMKSLGGHGASIITNTDLSAETCIRYALSQPISTLVLGMATIKELQENIKTARNFKPMQEEELARLVSDYREIAGDGRFEKFKSTQQFDGSHHRLQHGF
jgi:predicted aldo/keto reductase-like oxidoreductase